MPWCSLRHGRPICFPLVPLGQLMAFSWSAVCFRGDMGCFVWSGLFEHAPLCPGAGSYHLLYLFGVPRMPSPCDSLMVMFGFLAWEPDL